MRQKTPSEIARIVDIIHARYRDRNIELDHATPFQLLIAVILSAQTTDKQVNRITPPLFARVREPKDILSIPLPELEKYANRVNFFRNKAKYIKQTGERLARDYGGVIPNDLKLLQTFPGIGVKTAKVVLHFLYGEPLVGVDTHIHRVTNRIGIVKTKTPIQTDRVLEKKLTHEQRLKIHHPFVLFGRYHCTARAPKCPTCPVQGYCNYFKKTNSV